jgi:Uma2 family endonuclease
MAPLRYTWRMLHVIRPLQPMTIDEYLAFEETSGVRHEFVGGDLYAQAGASDAHNRIALNIASRLLGAAGDGPCRVYMSDMKLAIADESVYYPDVMVTCDPNDTDAYVKNNPCLVIEVLSPSTASIDRREKLLAYRRIPALKAYVILFQDEVRAIRHWRDDEGAWWQAEVANEGRVPLPCPRLDLTLAEIYRGIDVTS